MPPTTHKEPFRDRGHDVSLELTCAEPDGATPFPAIVCRGPPKVSSELPVGATPFPAIVCRGPPKVSSELPVLRPGRTPALTARYLTTQTLSFSQPTLPLPPPQPRRSLSSPKLRFDPLLVDPLAVVALDDPADAMVLEGEVPDSVSGDG
ncbi:hypothetical protein AMTR_s00025p00165360 [Amborella trichopoda]|uniref:Uncharacterized protein n=1 Tax=Amborella trichopoda TaxID=13333 RepID=W1PWE3_AMBTC|nr:hypothetical protein AMTR_s00025p00165360 [Amborella trichopoda]